MAKDLAPVCENSYINDKKENERKYAGLIKKRGPQRAHRNFTHPANCVKSC
jgi:hypothetical protein